MTLRQWLFRNKISITLFAALMKVDRTYVHRWLKGDYIPSEKIMERIREVSLNQVSKPEDLKDVRRI